MKKRMRKTRKVAAVNWSKTYLMRQRQENIDQGRSRGTKSRNLPGGKTPSCAKIANKVRALMARVGSLINCFHIIHLYSRKITLFLGQQ